MRDNPGGGESDPAECLQTLHEEFSFHFILHRYSRRDGEGQVPPRKPTESGRRGSCEKDFISTKSSECV